MICIYKEDMDTNQIVDQKMINLLVYASAI